MRLAFDKPTHFILGLELNGDALLLGSVYYFGQAEARVGGLGVGDNQGLNFPSVGGQGDLNGVDSVEILCFNLNKLGEGEKRTKKERVAHRLYWIVVIIINNNGQYKCYNFNIVAIIIFL